MSKIESKIEENFNPSSYGLTSLDIATVNVLKSIEFEDWEGLTTDLLSLSYTSGDSELNDIAEAHIKATKEQLDLVYAHGYNPNSITALNNYNTKMGILKERNLELFKILRLKMRTKGYLENDNKAHPVSKDKPHIGSE